MDAAMKSFGAMSDPAQEDGCSSLPCRGVLSFRSRARQASGSETPRVHHAAWRPAAAWPLAARAQPPAKQPLIGMLVPGTRATHGQWFAALVDRLRELGWIEGRTVAFEYRFAEGRTDRAAEIAAEFVRMKVDLIATSAADVTLAA